EAASDAVHFLQQRLLNRLRVSQKDPPTVRNFVVDPDAAVAQGAPSVRGGSPNRDPGGQNAEGDVDAAFKKCTAIIEGTYEAQTRIHCCLEPHGHVCKWDGEGDNAQLTMWASTQNASGHASSGFAGAKKKPLVICEHMGGGFGSKFDPREEGQICADLAKQA